MSTLKQKAKANVQKEDFKDRNIKVRVNTYIDLDIIKALKHEAEKKNKGYQTLLNERLREAVLSQENFEKRMKRIERFLRIGK